MHISTFSWGVYGGMLHYLYELVLFFYHSGDGAEVFSLGSKLLEPLGRVTEPRFVTFPWEDLGVK